MAKGKDTRSYKHDDAKVNKEFERVDLGIKEAKDEASKQKSVVHKDLVDTKIPEGVFHIDGAGNVFIKTKLGLKQVTLT